MNMTIDQARAKVQALNMEAQSAQNEYDERLTAIQANGDLSREGKNKAIKALLAEQRAKIGGLVSKLRRATIDEAHAAKLAQGVRDLVKREYSEWDYNRLAYEANRVKSAFVLAGGDDFENIMQAWQQAKARGDKYEIKAWMDNAPALLPTVPTEWETGHNPNVYGARQSIVEDIASAEIFTLTDEGKKFETERAERTANLEILAQAASQAGESLSQLGTFKGDTYIPGSTMRKNYIIERVFNGIALDRDNGELHVSSQPGETAEQMYNRTEAEYQEGAQRLQELYQRGGGAWSQGASADVEQFDSLLFGVE